MHKEPIKATGTEMELWSPAEIAAALDRNEIVLIDVRTPVEFAFEHIKGALLFPMWGFDPHKLPEQVSKRLVFHCGSGIRSARILARCAEAGVIRLAHMEGGFAAWKAAGLPYVATDPATGMWAMKK